MDKIKEIQWYDVKTSLPPFEINGHKDFSIEVTVTDGMKVAQSCAYYSATTEWSEEMQKNGFVGNKVLYSCDTGCPAPSKTHVTWHSMSTLVLGFIPTHWAYTNFLP